MKFCSGIDPVSHYPKGAKWHLSNRSTRTGVTKLWELDYCDINGCGPDANSKQIYEYLEFPLIWNFELTKRNNKVSGGIAKLWRKSIGCWKSWVTIPGTTGGRGFSGLCLPNHCLCPLSEKCAPRARILPQTKVRSPMPLTCISGPMLL